MVGVSVYAVGVREFFWHGFEFDVEWENLQKFKNSYTKSVPNFL